MIDYEDFEKVDIRVGQIISAIEFAKAKKPSYQLDIDFGPEIWIRKSSAQITVNYKPQDLINKKILAVVSFPPKQIADFISQVLVLWVPDANGNVVLVSPELDCDLWVRLY